VEFLELVGPRPGADEGHVPGVDNHEVLAAQAGDKVAFLRGDGYRAPALGEEGFARLGVAVGVRGKEAREGGPGTDVEPLDGKGKGGDVDLRIEGGGLHDAVVDAFLVQGRVGGLEALRVARGGGAP